MKVQTSPVSSLLSPLRGKSPYAEVTGLRDAQGYPGNASSLPNGATVVSLHSGLKEANDIVLYLKPLKISLEEMEQADFTMVHRQEKAHSVGVGVGVGDM